MKLVALELPLGLRKPHQLLPALRRRWVLRACALATAAVFLAYLFDVLLGSNAHAVVAGELFRSAQLDEKQLDRMIREQGIKTVVNLRGYNGWEDWYKAEARATSANDVSQEDLTTSANVPPSPLAMRKLVEIFDSSERPILVHCRRGSDRTGLASGIYLLLYTDATLADVRWACSPRYGHFRLMTTARMDEFFDQYEEFIAAKGISHSRETFRDWILNHYQAGPFGVELVVPDPPKWKANEPLRFTVTAFNRSAVPWVMKAGNFAGIHLRYQLIDVAGKVVVDERAGLFDRTVAVGESVELAVCLPPVIIGEYTLHLDMTAERHTAFSKIGVLPTVLRVEVTAR